MRKKSLSYLMLVLLLFLNHSSGESPSLPGQTSPEGFNPGPDIIAGNMANLEQFGSTGTTRGLATAITSCNAGEEFVGFFAMPSTDHPVVAQNLYRMSGGSNNNDRFEQIGQSWVKHTYGAKQADSCDFGCQPGGDFTHLGVGCSDTYFNFQSAEQSDLGSRAWINPFTGVFPTTARNHTGHNHTGVSHMMVVESADLNQTLNPGATYYAELAYVTPNEYAWCQAHPGECNMYNNESYLQFSVSGTTNFTFSQIGTPVRMVPAVTAWPGATINPIEPEPGLDGRAFIAYKVTGPVAGVWHYEYAIFNQNLDRSIQSFTVPLGCGATADNLGFHAPPNHPGFPNDGTLGDLGFSNAPWTTNQTADSVGWATETILINQNANAIRWGTLYNFRFDSSQPPVAANATIGFFKTGTPIPVQILGPSACTTTPTPTPTATAPPSPTPSATPTATPATVQVGLGGTTFTPASVSIQPGDTVEWIWASNNHSVTSGVPGKPDGIFDSGIQNVPFTFSHTFANAGTFPYYCRVHGSMMVGTVNVSGATPTPTPTPSASPTPAAAQTINLSTRMLVQADDGVGIGGFIITGTVPKQVVLLAIGPSLASSGVPNYLANPVLELHGPPGFTTIINDNWRGGSCDTGVKTGLPPTDDLEPCVLTTLDPGAYTAIVSGNGNPVGVALVEIYGLNQQVDSRLANLSTRAFVSTGNEIVVAGFILGGNSGDARIVIRGLGPSLAVAGVENPLADPTLELRNSNGDLLVTNNSFHDDPVQAAELEALGLAPINHFECGIIPTLPPGAYTALLSGVNNGTGLGLVEVYDLGSP